MSNTSSPDPPQYGQHAGVSPSPKQFDALRLGRAPSVENGVRASGMEYVAVLIVARVHPFLLVPNDSVIFIKRHGLAADRAKW